MGVEVVTMLNGRLVGGALMALAAALMFIFVEDVVVAVPITLLIVGIALIGSTTNERRS